MYYKILKSIMCCLLNQHLWLYLVEYHTVQSCYCLTLTNDFLLYYVRIGVDYMHPDLKFNYVSTLQTICQALVRP